jgi:hypothetical protein
MSQIRLRNVATASGFTDSAADELSRLVPAMTTIGGQLVLTGPGGGVIALSEVAPVITITGSGLLLTGPCEFGGFVVRAFGGGTPVLTLFDNTAGTGTPIVGPVNITALGPFPWMGAGTTQRRLNTTGLFATIGGTGTCTIDILARAA